MEKRILRRKALRPIDGLSDSQRDRMEAEGRYPRRRQITQRIVGWDSTEVQAWVNARLEGESETEAGRNS